jgi:type VI secretion system protein ImpK
MPAAAPVPSLVDRPAPPAGPGPGLAVGSGLLALTLQEALTAGARLRAGRQLVPDPAAFRAQLVQLVARADQDGRAAGYPPDDVRLTAFAVVAFLDETVLNARQPALADWARRPLQDELFGNHMGGEWFFQHVEQLLARPDTPELADLLEVHQLCLLLGFRGRYGADEAGALNAVAGRVGQRIARLRGAPGDLAPAWRPTGDATVARDPWLRRLGLAAAASVVLAAALWSAYALSLGGAVNGLRAVAALPTR